MQLKELGVEKLRIHEIDWENPNIYDMLGFAMGDPSFNNLIMVDTAIANNHPQKEQIERIRDKLHTYMGLQARYFEIKVELREEYVRKVAKNDPQALEELKRHINYRDRYQNSYSRYEQSPKEAEEYQTYINILGEIYNTKIRKLIEEFTEYEKAYNERERILHHFMSEQPNEAL